MIEKKIKLFKFIMFPYEIHIKLDDKGKSISRFPRTQKSFLINFIFLEILCKTIQIYNSAFEGKSSIHYLSNSIPSQSPQ